MRNPAVQTSEAVPKPPSCLHFVEAACPPCPDGPSLLVAKAVIITSGPTATRSRTTGHNTQLASTPPQEATQACPLRQPGQALNGPRQAGQRLPPSTGAPHEQRRRQFTRQAARSRASSWQLSSAPVRLRTPALGVKAASRSHTVCAWPWDLPCVSYLH